MFANKAIWETVHLTEAMKAREGSVCLPTLVRGISIDSRTILSEEAFFAIRGLSHYGHCFIPSAFSRGAGLAVVSFDFTGSSPLSVPHLLVEDVQQALVCLAEAARIRADQATRIAITGSVGKTSVKALLFAVLSKKNRTHVAHGSYNNHIGVPLTLANMPRDTRYGIFEIGMNHVDEVKSLARLISPHIAVITAVESVHLENLLNEAAIADAKAEIFSGLSKDGVAILPHDSPFYNRLVSHARACSITRIISFGTHLDSDVRLLQADLGSDYSRVTVCVFGQQVTYSLCSPGQAWIMNSLVVLAIAWILELDLSVSLEALAGHSALKGRGEKTILPFASGIISLIDQSYNASPASMKEAIAVLGHMNISVPGRRIAVLGDMAELGKNSPVFHQELSSLLREAKIDLVFCFGLQMHFLWDVLPLPQRGGWTNCLADLKEMIQKALQVGDVIMIKGSAVTKISELVVSLKADFLNADSRSSVLSDQHSNL